MTDPAANAPVLRRDAQRNLVRVMEEAERLFSERGGEVSVAEIAAAAGVGKATVYRSFPTKDDLVEAVAARRYAWFTARLGEAQAEPEPWPAFERLVHDLGARLGRDRALGAVLREAHGRPALVEAKAASLAALQALMDRAIADGSMRPGALARDVGILVSGSSTALATLAAEPGDWLRIAGLVVNAFRA